MSSTFVYDHEMSPSGASCEEFVTRPGGKNDSDAHAC